MRVPGSGPSYSTLALPSYTRRRLFILRILVPCVWLSWNGLRTTAPFEIAARFHMLQRTKRVGRALGSEARTVAERRSGNNRNTWRGTQIRSRRGSGQVLARFLPGSSARSSPGKQAKSTDRIGQVHNQLGAGACDQRLP